MEAGLASGEIGGVAGAELGCTALVARLSEASETLSRGWGGRGSGTLAATTGHWH